jgi:diacylglycerol kinase (ATP)
VERVLHQVGSRRARNPDLEATLSAPDTASTTVIVNPRAGGVVGTSTLSEALEPLRPARVVETTGPGHARSLASEAAQSGVALIVVVGGDGTLHEVVNGLEPSASCALGIIPAGTGNDTARSLGIPLDHDEAVRLIAGGEAHPTDLISVEVDGEEEYAINAACGGFGGAVNERMTDELKERWGPLSYIRTAADALTDIPVYRVRLRVDDGEEEELSLHSLVVANGPFAARGVSVAPGAQPDDGRLAVHAVVEATLTELLSMVPGAVRGEVPASDHYRVWSCSHVDVSSSEPMDVSVDGELRSGSHFRYEVIRGGLRVFRP